MQYSDADVFWKTSKLQKSVPFLCSYNSILKIDFFLVCLVVETVISVLEYCSN